MPVAAIFSNGRNQAVRIPRDLEFHGIKEVEIIKDGDCLILKPFKPSWTSFLDIEKADADFLNERPAVIDETRILGLSK
jgi:antitoxin VapB